MYESSNVCLPALYCCAAGATAEWRDRADWT